MFERLIGIPAHDHRGSHFPFPMSSAPCATPASCGICLLLAVEIEDGEPRAGRTRRLLLQSRLATWLARKKGEKLSPRFLAMFERACVRILEETKLRRAGLRPFGPARGGKPGRKKRRPGLDPDEGMP